MRKATLPWLSVGLLAVGCSMQSTPQGSGELGVQATVETQQDESLTYVSLKVPNMF